VTVWFTMRGTGLAALVLLTATTCLGVVMSAGGGTIAARYVAQHVHRTTALLGLGALTLHVITALVDPDTGVGVVGTVVPFTSGYRTAWTGLGTIATYLMLVAAATGLARRRFAQTPRAAAAWRGLHWTAYGAWAFAMLHGFESGTDSGLGWVRVLYLVCLAAVPACVLARTPAHCDERTPAVTR
jgi:hypothetical protein